LVYVHQSIKSHSIFLLSELYIFLISYTPPKKVPRYIEISFYSPVSTALLFYASPALCRSSIGERRESFTANSRKHFLETLDLPK